LANFKIGKKLIGDNCPTLLISEVGVNHNGSVDRGYKLIEESVKSGADIVKFQTYKASQIVTKSAKRYWSSNRVKAPYQ
jgi:N,N'-diacetyllegionaminate synthase